MSEPVANPSDTSYSFMEALSSAVAASPPPAEPAPQPAAQPAAPIEQPAPQPEAAPEAKMDEESTALEKLIRGEDVELPKEEKKAEEEGEEWGNPKSRKAWADARAEINRLRKERQEFENQRRELESKIPKDYDSILKERDEYKNQLAAKDLTLTEDFQREVEQPLRSLFGEFKQVAEQFKIKEYALAEAVNEPNELERNRKLSAIFDSLEEPPPPSYVARLGLKADRIHEIREMREQMLASAPDILAELEQRKAQEEQAKQAHQKELYSQASKSAMQIMEQHIPLFKGEGGKELAKAVQAEMDKDISTLKPMGKAMALAAPVIVQALLKAQKGHQEALTAKEKEVASLKLQLQKLSGASPTLQPSAPAAPVNGGDSSFEKSLAEAVAAMHGGRR